MARAEPGLPFALHTCVVACSPNLVPRAFSVPPIFWGKSPGDEVAALPLWYSSLFLSVDVDAAYDTLLTCLATGVFDWQYSRIRINGINARNTSYLLHFLVALRFALSNKWNEKKELEFRFMENLHLLEGIALLRFLKKTVDETGWMHKKANLWAFPVPKINSYQQNYRAPL